MANTWEILLVKGERLKSRLVSHRSLVLQPKTIHFTSNNFKERRVVKHNKIKQNNLKIYIFKKNDTINAL